jgi:hypothetical protein
MGQREGRLWNFCVYTGRKWISDVTQLGHPSRRGTAPTPGRLRGQQGSYTTAQRKRLPQPPLMRDWQGPYFPLAHPTEPGLPSEPDKICVPNRESSRADATLGSELGNGFLPVSI